MAAASALDVRSSGCVRGEALGAMAAAGAASEAMRRSGVVQMLATDSTAMAAAAAEVDEIARRALRRWTGLGQGTARTAIAGMEDAVGSAP